MVRWISINSQGDFDYPCYWRLGVLLVYFSRDFTVIVWRRELIISYMV